MFSYCPYCGSKTIQKEVDGGEIISFCSQCKISLEDMFTTGIICAVVNEYNEVALLRHNNGAESQFNCPTGVIKNGETPEETVRRTVQEEIGFDVEWLEFIESYFNYSKNMLMLGYKAYVKKADSAKWAALKSALDKMKEDSIEKKLIKYLQFDIRTQMFSNIDKEIDLIRRHPAAYIGKKSISAFEQFIYGYYFVHQYPRGGFASFEPLPFFFFNIFAANNYNVSASAPWGWIFLEQAKQDEEKGLELFFQMYDSFRAIKIANCQRIVLTPENIQYHCDLSGIESKLIIRESFSNKDEGIEMPIYLHAQKLYCISYTNKFGHLFVVEYSDACCCGYFTSKQSIRNHAKKFFGNVRWKTIEKSLLPQKPIYRRREILDAEGHCRY